MGHTWKNGSHLEKWVTFGNMAHTLEKGSHAWKKLSNLEKKVTLGKMGHRFESCHTWKNGSHLEKWVTLGKMGVSWTQIIMFICYVKNTSN